MRRARRTAPVRVAEVSPPHRGDVKASRSVRDLSRSRSGLQLPAALESAGAGGTLGAWMTRPTSQTRTCELAKKGRRRQRPENEAPVSVAIDAVLLEGPDSVVLLGNIQALSNGVAFS